MQDGGCYIVYLHLSDLIVYSLVEAYQYLTYFYKKKAREGS